MPKNRYAPMFNSVFYSDNCTELYCEDNLYGTGKGTATLTGIETSDWANIANNMPVSVYFFDAAGNQSSTRAFIGIIASTKYITQKSVEVKFEDYSLKLKRWPVSKDVIKDRFQYTRENATVGELVNIFATEEMAASGGTLIVTIGTVDDSTEIVPKFDGFFASRWDMFLKLAQQLKRFVYFDNVAALQFRKVRGYSLIDSGSGTASGITFTDGSKSWGTNAYKGYVLIDTKAAFIISSNTSTTLTVNGSPTSGDYQIADMVQARGTGTASSNTFYVSGAGWTVNQWAGYTLLDVASGYLILSNTSDTLTVSGTPASGAFQILMGFYSTGGSKNGAFSDREYNSYNIWNDVTVVGYNGVTANFRDISTKVAYTTQSDTRLARDFNSKTDTTIYVESLVGIPNSPGIILIQGGTRNFSGSPAFSKTSGIFYYSGTSGNTLTGVSCWDTYSTPFKENGLGAAVYFSRTKVQFLHKLRVTSTTGFASSGNLLVGTEVIPYASKGNDNFLMGEVGTGVASGSTFTDSSKAWTTNQWAGYVLIGTSDPSDPGYPIVSNNSTQLTVTGSPPTGIYMIVHGYSGLPVYFRPPIISTNLSSAAQATDTSLTVSSTSAFNSYGTLKIYSSGGGVEIIEYDSKDATHFLSCHRGTQDTTPMYIPSGSSAISYYSSGIHPTQVRVQQYPSGGTPETGSSIQVNGRMPKTFPYPYVLTIENAEQIASRLLMNHRWGDQFIQFSAYSPKNYQNVNVGHTIQFTDSTLDLSRYTDKVVHKELHQHLADGEFFSKFSIGVQPKSDMDKLLDKIYELVGMKNPNNQQYITGDTPLDILTLQCGSPAVRLNAPGLDVSNTAGRGFINSNHVWIQEYNSAGPRFQETPFYSYGLKADSGGLFFPVQDDPDPTTTDVSTGLEGALYYNYTSHTLRWHNGTTWADVGSGGGGGYWTRIGTDLTPSTLNDTVSVGAGDCSITLEKTSTTRAGLSIDGTQANITLDLTAKGAGVVSVNSNLYVDGTLEVYGKVVSPLNIGASDSNVKIYRVSSASVGVVADGSSANIDLNLYAKGTGKLWLGGDIYFDNPATTYGIKPNTTASYNLGTTGLRWNNIYGGAAYLGGAYSIKCGVLYGNTVGITTYGTSPADLAIVTSTGGSIIPWSPIIPINDSTLNLGSTSYRWNAFYINSINAKGEVSPSANATYSLGSSSYRWNVAYVGSVNAAGEVSPSVTATYSLGSASYQWNILWVKKVICDTTSTARLRIPVGTDMYG